MCIRDRATGTTDPRAQEQFRISGIVRRDFCPALPIDAASGEALGLDYFPVPVESYPSYFEERRCERQSVSA